MVSVAVNKLYVLNERLDRNEYLAAISAGIIPGAVYWLVGSRRGLLGEYLGNYQGTYKHRGAYSPDGRDYNNLPCRYFLDYEGA